MLGVGMRLSKGIDNWRALDHYRWFLVPWQMCYGRFVDTSARVNIHCVDDFCARFRVSIRVMLILILPGGSQEETAIRRECESAEE